MRCLSCKSEIIDQYSPINTELPIAAICDSCVQKEADRRKKAQMELPMLSKSFYVSTGKTLKLEIRPETQLTQAIQDAKTYLESKDCTHSRIEFKFGHCYIVIARLNK